LGAHVFALSQAPGQFLPDEGIDLVDVKIPLYPVPVGPCEKEKKKKEKKAK
jgi:hypothetical protein